MANDVEARPSKAEVQAFVRQCEELESLDGERDYAALERIAVAIYENRDQPVKDKWLRSRLFAEVAKWAAQAEGAQGARLRGLVRKQCLELLDRHRDELLPEAEAEIVCYLPWREVVGRDVPSKDEVRLETNFAKHDRARAVRYFFRAYQRLEAAGDPDWKAGREPVWHFVKPKFGDGDEQVVWKQEPPMPASVPWPSGLPWNFYYRGEHDPAEIPDPMLRAEYIKVVKENNAIEERYHAQGEARRELSDFVPVLVSRIGYYYSAFMPSVPGAREELEGLLREFKIDASIHQRILAGIAKSKR